MGMIVRLTNVLRTSILDFDFNPFVAVDAYPMIITLVRYIRSYTL